MGELFLMIVNRSVSASWLILAVILLRLVLKKAPKWISCALWALAAVRLLCPVSIESTLSLVPGAQVFPQQAVVRAPSDVHTGLAAVEEPVNGYPVGGHFGGTPAAAGGGFDVTAVLGMVWLCGMLVLAAYACISYYRLYRQVRVSLRLRDNIRLCDEIAAPFILGVLRPQIYIPSGTPESRMGYIIAHEQAHLKRRDHWWKPLGFLVLTLHWFNPLVWAGYILLCRDIELACDEKVIQSLGRAQSIAYSEALLSCSVKRKTIQVCPLAFGEVGVKERVKRVLNYKKPAFWVVAASAAVCAATALCFLTDPKPARSFAMSGRNVSDLDPDGILAGISAAQGGLDPAGIYTGTDHFELMLTADFDWKESETVRFFYTEEQKTYSAQLRISADEKQCFVTEPSEWVQQMQRFSLYSYLSAVKDLPQEKIREMAPDADAYALELKSGGTPEDFTRVISYTPQGVQETADGAMHLQLQPLHQKGGEYHGTGGEVIHLFYGAGAEEWAKLDQAVSDAILHRFDPGQPDGRIRVESHRTFLTSGPSAGEGSTITVYLLALHESFSADADPDSLTQSVDGSCVPAALTFRIGADGEYQLAEYWDPQTGGEYEDLRTKFPQQAQEQLLRQEEYAGAMRAENREKARALLDGTGSGETRTEDLLNVVCASPAEASDPETHIRENPDAYQELVSRGDGTLEYCFARFLSGGQTDLRGQIMARLCQDIMTQRGEPMLSPQDYENGQWWFEQFWQNVKKTAGEIGGEQLEKRYPAAHLLQTMQTVSAEGEILGVYEYAGGDPKASASITLYEDGNFLFLFSPISNYIGDGRYTLENDRLTLHTSDGKFVYVFDVKENQLIFDAEGSSDAVWFSGLENGSVLNKKG